MTVLGIILFIIGYLLVDFVITTGIIAIVCWAFGIVFTWKLAIGIYCIIALISSIFRISKKS